MAVEHAGLQNFVSDALREAGRVQVGSLLCLHQLGVDRRRRQHVAKAQARRQDLGERPHVDHASRVQRMQRRQRRAAVAQLAVGVVLDQQHAKLPGSCHQFLAAL